ncbi:MAG: undecaprenyldiphospho-muramoylpentapeptide beta-N-acetylglucosaminyltransferase [Elusimicrobia bacterium GWA2_64_40]|nr:MAG: undecaprenyldiphospho-muramoylpentapeptide beta-N-acetylglucosaminyltransferase [Elusimicrobia bacterium GWA2_64_40]OGR66910.1 MAG: undecaprenyldiphospho-muramoylpentapeptide beta-N-acetylglucosaminyltransferase [Elusimicrobia bacterium GWB2_63_16]
MVAARRVLIASGGTGGHFYPGFALAGELRRRGWQTLFLVKKEDIARPALEAADFPYAELDMTALPRSLNPLAHAAFLAKFFRSLALARRMMADYKPDAVVGTGSYVAFPAALAARLAGIPVYIHESNAKFGLGNRLAGLFCDRAALGLPVAGNPLAARSVLAGTPIREAFRAAPDKAAARAALGLEKGKFTVLVFGGSQGARRLNAAFIAAAKALKGDIQALHVTGRKNFEAVQADYAEAGLDGAPGLKVFDYREDMPALYAAADLVVSRSGASTVAELAHLRKPSILVPLPSSAGDHQRHNALALAGPGAALCLQEGPDFDAELAAAVRNYTGEPARLAAMAEAFPGAGIPDGLGAAAALADIIEKGR